MNEPIFKDEKPKDSAKCSSEPVKSLFKDVDPFTDEKSEKYRKYTPEDGCYDQEISEGNEIASLVLGIISLILLIVIPLLTRKLNFEIAIYSFCGGFILAMISCALNMKSAASRVTLIAAIVIVIVVALVVIDVIIQIENQCSTCFGCAGSGMP